MSDGALKVLDGTHLRSLSVSPPESGEPLTGAHILDFAESTVKDSLFGLSLPPTLRSSALRRANIFDDVTFRQSHLSKDAAKAALNDYIAAIADELKENPVVVSVLDGETVRLFLEDEDDFAMMAENVFTDLDIEDTGKIKKAQIRNALVNMGVEMGIPPFQEFPLLNDILKKYGVEGEEELGVSQFAELLHPILQEVADSLAKNHVTVIHNILIFNGSKIRKLLADEEQLHSVIEKIMQEMHSRKDDRRTIETIKSFLEKNGQELGLPPSDANDAVLLLYDAVFNDVESEKSSTELDDEFRGLVREILQKFAEELESNPVFCDLDG